MLFTKVKVFSLYPSSYWRAMSTSTSSLIAVNAMGLGLERLLVPVEPFDELHQSALGEESLGLALLALVL